MWHEIGHKLDDVFGLSQSYDHAEANAAMQRKYGNNVPYQANDIPGEGVAEFVKEYMNDPQKAKFSLVCMTMGGSLGYIL